MGEIAFAVGSKAKVTPIAGTGLAVAAIVVGIAADGVITQTAEIDRLVCGATYV